MQEGAVAGADIQGPVAVGELPGNPGRHIAFAAAREAQLAGAEVVLTGYGRFRRLTARAAREVPEPVEILEARLRSERRRFFRPPQHSDHSAHLGQRLTPGSLDDEQRVALAFLVGSEQPAHTGRRFTVGY